MRRNSDERIRGLERLVADGDLEAETELAVAHERQDGLAAHLDAVVTLLVAPLTPALVGPAHVRRLASPLVIEDHLLSLAQFGVPDVYMSNAEVDVVWGVGLLDPKPDLPDRTTVPMPFVTGRLTDQTVRLCFGNQNVETQRAPWPSEDPATGSLWSRAPITGSGPWSRGPIIASLGGGQLEAPAPLVRRWILLGRRGHFGRGDALVLAAEERVATDPEARRRWANLRDDYHLLFPCWLDMRGGVAREFSIFSSDYRIAEQFVEDVARLNRPRFRSINALCEVVSEEDEATGRREPNPWQFGAMLARLALHGEPLPEAVSRRLGETAILIPRI